MKKQLAAAVIATLSAMTFTQCSKTNNAVIVKEIKVADSEIQFSADSAFKYVKEQTLFGPRVPGSESHSKCLAYLKNTLERMGTEVTIQEGEGKSFEGKMLPVRNVIAKINPQKANRVILCSHWDSRPFADQDEDTKYHNTPIDGANDGASGVGVLIEIARQMQIRKPGIGIDIILFDTEDYGTPEHIKMKEYVADTWCLGSQYWAKSELGENCQARYGILLDMVGAQGAQFFQEYHSKSTAQSVIDKVWKAAQTIGYGNYFVNDNGGYITDDHYYVYKHAKIPCIDIIQYDPSSSSSFYKHWHTHNDTADNIDKATLEAVGRTLLYVLYNE
ncbi:MAG: M28 family peptidase [Bacteroidales bacterium]|nr:M28 family peptidase [Bacteroidales bacterium]